MGIIGGRQTVLIAEGDALLRGSILTALEAQGVCCLAATSAKGALDSIATHNPDIILLDPALFDGVGSEAVGKVRSLSRAPILVLSDHAEDADKIDALDAGADDYLVKPFSVDELSARVRVALRHAASVGTLIRNRCYENGTLSIDYASESVSLDGCEIHLTPMEYKLVCLLARNTGKVITYDHILKQIWGTTLECDKASLQVLMATLRKKIEPDTTRPCFIRTHVGVGYRMLRQEPIPSPPMFSKRSCRNSSG